MNNEFILYLVIGLIIGAVLGIIISSILSPKSRRYNQVKKELDATKQELITQKQTIVKHFSHSAELLDNMAKDFRRLYQHMAENSSSLLSDIDLNDPEYDAINNLKTEDTPKIATTHSGEQPKDYSGNPSGLLKTDTENKA